MAKQKSERLRVTRNMAMVACLIAGIVAAFMADTSEELMVVAQRQPAETGADGQPIIFWKIKEEDRQAIIDLLDRGCDIETKGGFGMTPIIQAAQIDDWITVELLLQRGADPLVADRRGFTVTYRAATSRVAQESTYGQALGRVRTMLDERGIGGVVYEPADVKKMLASGEWPPL